MAQTIAHAVHSELVIRKSRFLGCVQPVADRAEAVRVVGALKAEHAGATHVCWALLAGGDSAAVDDGEPGGTAGHPMLNVLRQQELDGVLATVVRYFGGIKLGAGGLVHAYTDAVAQALKNADKVVIRHWVTQGCTLPYALEGSIRRELDLLDARHLQVRHTDQVHMRFEIDETVLPDVTARLDELARGELFWHPDKAD